MHVIDTLFQDVSSGRPWLSYRAGKREQHAQQKDKLQGFQWLSQLIQIQGFQGSGASSATQKYTTSWL